MINFPIKTILILSAALLLFACSSSVSTVRPLSTGDLAVGISLNYNLNVPRFSGKPEFESSFWWGYGLGDDYDLFLTPDIIWTVAYLAVSPFTDQAQFRIKNLASLEIVPPFILRKSFPQAAGGTALGIANFSGYAGDRIGHKNIGLFAEVYGAEQPWFYSLRIFAGYQAAFDYVYRNGLNLRFDALGSHSGRIDRDFQYYSLGYRAVIWLWNPDGLNSSRLKIQSIKFQMENIGDQNENF